MEARIVLTINPIQYPRIEETSKRSINRLLKLNKFITKSVNYYIAEEFLKNVTPMRWLD